MTEGKQWDLIISNGEKGTKIEEYDPSKQHTDLLLEKFIKCKSVITLPEGKRQ
jgi:hypothetical protein